LTLAFVDTGAWIALLVPRDLHHRSARDLFRSIARETHLLTTNYVLAETVTWLAYHDAHKSALQFKDMTEAAERAGLLTTAWVMPQVHADAWRFFERFDDQDVSFCDCSSFVVCEARRVDFVFGFDKHFTMAGFDLRPKP
jgi:predicted nucleic acid-binding protein